MASSATPPAPKLLWIDLEMTGLDPHKDRILEVAAIVTDLEFNELEDYHAVVQQDPALLETMDEWNQTTHQQSGLLDKVADGISESQAEQDLLELIARHFDQPVVLAGNSIYFDRRFIEAYWPQLAAKLHYRMLDVTAWKVVLEAKFKHQFKKAESHRALDDIHESIAELKDYLEYLRKGEK